MSFPPYFLDENMPKIEPVKQPWDHSYQANTTAYNMIIKDIVPLLFLLILAHFKIHGGLFRIRSFYDRYRSKSTLHPFALFALLSLFWVFESPYAAAGYIRSFLPSFTPLRLVDIPLLALTYTIFYDIIDYLLLKYTHISITSHIWHSSLFNHILHWEIERRMVGLWKDKNEACRLARQQGWRDILGPIGSAAILDRPGDFTIEIKVKKETEEGLIELDTWTCGEDGALWKGKVEGLGYKDVSDLDAKTMRELGLKAVENERLAEGAGLLEVLWRRDKDLEA